MNVALDSGITCADTSALVGCTVRWMSPELLLPENFGLSHSNPTKASDTYALGMVIFEVSLSIGQFSTTSLKLRTVTQILTGSQPFAETKRNESVAIGVVAGKRPVRPPNSRKMGFSNDLWKLLDSCWKAKSAKRPTAKTVREFLQGAATTWTLWQPAQASPQTEEDVYNETSHRKSNDLSRSGTLVGNLEANAKVVSKSMIRNSC
jgi:serine/threonine protein kinase